MSSKPEFETKTAVLEFRELFKQAFPNGCGERQKADLLLFFLAGYTGANAQWGDAIVKLGFEGATVFMQEINSDTMSQIKYAIHCTAAGDFSHDIFS